jgi:hypothetical protein
LEMGPMDTGCPCAREPHLTSWAVLWLAALAIVVGHRVVWHSNKWATPWTPEQMPALAGAGMAAAVAFTWPLANLAAHGSQTALVIQRLILTLTVPPLVLVSVLMGMSGDRRPRSGGSP